MGDDLRAAAARRPRVRVNQVGYLPSGPKRATVVTGAVQPLPFAVRTVHGNVVATGTTTPFPAVDPSSGLNVHGVDFSEVHTSDGRVRLTVEDAASWPFKIREDIYDDLFGDALRFFYAQRSGIEIDDDVLPGYARPPGHIGVPPNQGDVAVRGWSGADAARLYPGWRLDRDIDVSGGWYDAGDHGKYVVSGGLSAALLLSAWERTRIGGTGPPPAAGAGRTSGPSLLDEALWKVDWMLRMQVPAGEQHAGMAFHRVHDDHWTPLPLAPHDDPALRVLHRPSTAATLNLAAVAAQAARLVNDADPGRASRLLDAAYAAYAAAKREPRLLAPDDAGAYGGGPYDDVSIDDEFYWAAAELYLATGDPAVLDDVTTSPCHHDDVFDPGGFDWNEVAAVARLNLATGASDLADRVRVQDSVVAAADRLCDLQASQPWDQPYAPDDGWDWGSNGRILSNLIVLATAYDIGGDRRHRNAALAGLDFVFGRNAVGLSFVTGYGTEFAHRQRVRHFGHALDASFPPPPPGSLAGGPASKTYPGFSSDPRFDGLPPQFWYVDDPTSETTNDVCIRWNAALVWMSAFVLDETRGQRARVAGTDDERGPTADTI